MTDNSFCSPGIHVQVDQSMALELELSEAWMWNDGGFVVC